jgi:hypothetical protein
MRLSRNLTTICLAVYLIRWPCRAGCQFPVNDNRKVLPPCWQASFTCSTDKHKRPAVSRSCINSKGDPSGRPTVLFHQIAQDRMQDAAVAVVVDFDAGIEQGGGLEFNHFFRLP